VVVLSALARKSTSKRSRMPTSIIAALAVPSAT
jgi:hypothetical protein